MPSFVSREDALARQWEAGYDGGTNDGTQQ